MAAAPNVDSPVAPRLTTSGIAAAGDTRAATTGIFGVARDAVRHGAWRRRCRAATASQLHVGGADRIGIDAREPVAPSDISESGTTTNPMPSSSARHGCAASASSQETPSTHDARAAINRRQPTRRSRRLQ
jgi:hypothetical protein